MPGSSPAGSDHPAEPRCPGHSSPRLFFAAGVTTAGGPVGAGGWHGELRAGGVVMTPPPAGRSRRTSSARVSRSGVPRADPAAGRRSCPRAGRRDGRPFHPRHPRGGTRGFGTVAVRTGPSPSPDAAVGVLVGYEAPERVATHIPSRRAAVEFGEFLRYVRGEPMTRSIARFGEFGGEIALPVGGGEFVLLPQWSVAMTRSAPSSRDSRRVR